MSYSSNTLVVSISPIKKDESDEEESTAYRSTDPDDPNSQSSTLASRKKKRRWRRYDPRPKRWILQEKAEFLQRVTQRKKKMAGVESGEEDDTGPNLSNQYHGVVESNASKYVLLSVTPQSSAVSIPSSNNGSSNVVVASESITLQPIHGFHNFSQPYKTAGLSMEEAESAIEQQRNVVTRYMMHGRYANSASDKNEAAAALAAGVVSVGRGRGGRPVGPPPKAMSRARLLGKLTGSGGGGGGAGGNKEEEDDDVMGDLKFETKRGGSRARKELLQSMADEGVTVDDDGVLGGANDAEFGGRRRFARVAADENEQEKQTGKAETGATATGFEAGAMEEGFYQRDVGAEYEALDYDANEQFDDDDVNLGEDEIENDGGGFADQNDSDDDAFDSDDGSNADDDGFAGIASSSGLKAMLAKARGDSPTNLSTDGTGSEGQASAQGGESEAINKMLDAAKKTAEELEKKKTDPAATSESADQIKVASVQEPKAIGIEKDKDGKRLITMEAIRREIWLNNGAIKSKRLMRIFEVTAKNPERQAVFKQAVMELCIMKKDADGNKLVLKPHYAKSS